MWKALEDFSKDGCHRYADMCVVIIMSHGLHSEHHCPLTVYFSVKLRIQSFAVLAVLRRSLLRICGGHLRVIAPRQHSSFRRNVAAVASRWPLGV